VSAGVRLDAAPLARRRFSEPEQPAALSAALDEIDAVAEPLRALGMYAR
jgi:hypothetical protein